MVDIRDFRRIRLDAKEWEQVLYEQPILVSTRLPLDIYNYRGGVHPGTDCHEQVKHGMLLVGHGSDEQGRPFWLLRNSMGRRWGQSGHLELLRSPEVMKRCFVTAFVAKFKFEELDEEAYDSWSAEFEPTLEPEPEVELEPRSSAGYFQSWLEKDDSKQP